VEAPIAVDLDNARFAGAAPSRGTANNFFVLLDARRPLYGRCDGAIDWVGRHGF
jgi:hypothetical protein